MQRVAQVFRVKPGQAENYARRHRTLWPELEDLLKRHGVQRYGIYAWGEILFSYMEVDDYDSLAETWNSNETAQRWEAEMTELIEIFDVDPSTGWPLVLKEIWSLGSGDDRRER